MIPVVSVVVTVALGKGVGAGHQGQGDGGADDFLAIHWDSSGKKWNFRAGPKIALR
jgi:hypothetical protein